MKKIMKILGFLLVIGIIINFLILCMILRYGVLPALQDNNISIAEIIFKDISHEKYNALRSTAAAKGKELAEKMSNKFFTKENAEKIINHFSVDISELPAARYPYPDNNEVLETVNSNAITAAEQGINILLESSKKE